MIISRNQVICKGWYITPFGTFIGSSQQDILPANTLIRWCCNCDKIICRLAFSHSDYLKGMGEYVIGKTFKEIGFNFVSSPKVCNE